MDATITNWCVVGEDVTVTLGCSRVSPAAPACKNGTKVTGDPGCPIQSGPANHCSSSLPPVCVQTWTERCDNGSAFCTDDLTAIWCTVCE